jgi:hypothetical protein
MMKDSNNTEVYIDPVAEARRYVQNAKDLLNEKGKFNAELQLYEDRKYVRMAGDTLWKGVLLILDAVFHVKQTARSRPSIGKYLQAVGARDRKLQALVICGYETMHLIMGYDGNQRKATCQDGINIANDIIDRCAVMLS